VKVLRAGQIRRVRSGARREHRGSRQLDQPTVTRRELRSNEWLEPTARQHYPVDRASSIGKFSWRLWS
jgi:hypothetical protein